MNVERLLRLAAGFFVMASVALGVWVNPNWFWFTAFVGLITVLESGRQVWTGTARQARRSSDMIDACLGLKPS